MLGPRKTHKPETPRNMALGEGGIGEGAPTKSCSPQPKDQEKGSTAKQKSFRQ